MAKKLENSKVANVWRNNGWWANLYIDFDNGLRLVVRLSNEGSQDIQLEEITSANEQMIVINDTSEVNVECNLIGRTYDLSPLIECDGEIEKTIKNVVEECWLNGEYIYPKSWDREKIIAPSTNNKATDMMLQDFFNVAFIETRKMIKKSKEK